MTQAQKEERLAKIKEHIARIDSKECNVYVMMVDSKGMPNGAIEYVYTLAYALKEDGYNVTILHQEEDFVGVEEWMGEKYAKLPHRNIEKENVEIGPADFLFVPDFLSNLLGNLRDLSCKKIGVVSNRSYLADVMPITSTWADLDVRFIVTNTEENAEFVKSYFRGVETVVIPPSVANCFRDTDAPRTPAVNLVTKRPSDASYIMKCFYWKYPQFGWVPFKDVRGFPQDTVANMFREGAITAWVDRDTNFGYGAVEAAKCGSIVLGVVPNEAKSWMVEGDKLTDGIIWANGLDEIVDLIAMVVDKWIRDEVPSAVYENQKVFEKKFSPEEMVYNVKNQLGSKLFEQRKKNFEEVYAQLSSAPVTEEDNKKKDEE